MENEEKFLLFTTDGCFNEFVPEAEAETAERILGEYAKHSKENKYVQYMILCPDGIVRSQYEVYKHYLVTHEKQLLNVLAACSVVSEHILKRKAGLSD